MALHVESKTDHERGITRLAIIGSRGEVAAEIARRTTNPETRSATFLGPWCLEGGVYGAMGEIRT